VLRRLSALALAGAACELALSAATDREWRRAGVAAPLAGEPLRSAYRIGALGLGVGVPLALNAAQIAARRPSRAVAMLAALAALAGGFVLRAVLVFAGNASGRRPEDYLRFTQPPADTSASDARGVS
jgi:formate-dependent nitrite reductase membrane component NrfD